MKMPRTALLIGACTWILTLGGCPQQSTTPTFVMPTLTATLQFLENNVDQFRTDDAAFTGTPATAADLDGCWGRAIDTAQTTSSGTMVDVTSIDVYQFDADAGSVTHSMFSRDADGLYAIVLIGSGTFSVADGVATIALTDWRGNDPDDGVIKTITGASDITYNVQVDVADGELLLTTETDEGDVFTRYTGFTCVE